MRGVCFFSSTFCILFLVVLLPFPAFAEEGVISIGTGGQGSVYHTVGGAICQAVAKARGEHGLRCSVQTTDGSVQNVQDLRSGHFDFAIVQSDVQFKAYKAEGSFSDRGPDPKLRSVFLLHKEAFSLLSRSDQRVERFDDLKGKRVNIGRLGSGQRGMMRALMKAFGWTVADFAFSSELRPREQSQALCDGNIDVMAYTVGHPSRIVLGAMEACKATLVRLEGAIVEDFLVKYPYYETMFIPGGMYPGEERSVPTIGVNAILATSASVSDERVYALVKAVFRSIEWFRTLHPVLKATDPGSMSDGPFLVPLHPGAERYFRESGIPH